MNEEKIHLRRRTWSLKSSPVIAAGLVLILATAQAQQAGTPAASEDESAATNAANNPTTPKLTFEAQDYWMPSVSGLGGRGGSNGLQRNIVPIQTFGFWNLFHVIVPVDTNPNSPGGTLTGLGGLQLYNLSTVKLRGTTYGAGPLVVLPTESGSHFGTQKWQAGVLVYTITKNALALRQDPGTPGSRTGKRCSRCQQWRKLQIPRLRWG
jgi:hypothetical protein